MNKRILGGLAAAALLTGGFAITMSVAQAAPSSYEVAWTNDMNQATYWNTEFATATRTVSCAKYENHSGDIPAQYDAVVIKDGAEVVRVYPDLTTTGAFTAQGATNPANGQIFPAPHSWVMKCTFIPVPPDTTTTTKPPDTTTTTKPPDTTTTTKPPDTTTTEPPDTTTTEPPDTTTTEPPDTTTTEPPDTTTTEPPDTTTTEPPATTTTEPPATTTTEPPATTTTEFVAAFPPTQAPTTSAPAVSPAMPTAGLPTTGTNGTSVAALIALLVTSLGGAALLLARRRDVTS